MSNFNGFTGNNDPVYYSHQTENADGTLTNEDTKQAGNSPVIPDGWRDEAEKLAEEYGMSFVLFRHGEMPECADPTKVVISFTDKGLGHDTPPAATAGIPIIPEGYVMVPKEPTEDMRDAYYESSVAPISRLSICGYQAMLAAAPQEEKP